MEARLITDKQQWNDFVAASPYCNITQSYEWGELTRTVGSEPLYMGVVDEQGQLQAAMLVLISHHPTMRSTYFYAPRGPIVENPHSPAVTMLLNLAKAQARQHKAFMLKVEPGADDGDATWLSALRHYGFQQVAHAQHVRSEWVLDLRPDEKQIQANMKEKWRYNIRLAGRKGVTVRRGEGKEDMDTFYRIFVETSTRDEFYINPRTYYDDFMRLYGEDDRAALFLAEYEGKPIAGIVMVRFGRWSWYRYGASSVEHRNVMPNHLLQWNGMQWAKAHGCWYYNFMGIPEVLENNEQDPLWGIYTFKRGFGGYAKCALASHDLPYNPILYRTYRLLLDTRHKIRELRSNRS